MSWIFDAGIGSLLPMAGLAMLVVAAVWCQVRG
jgi:hypothetical protein